MTIAAYQTLYESSVAFGMRKSLMSEQGKSDMEEEINSLKKEKRELEQQVYTIRSSPHLDVVGIDVIITTV